MLGCDDVQYSDILYTGVVDDPERKPIFSVPRYSP